MKPDMPALVVTELESPIGVLRVGAHAGGIARLLFPTQYQEELELDLSKNTDALAHLERAAEGLVRYFEGDSHAFEALSLTPFGTAFQLGVWNALSRIPYGTTTTYGAIAKVLHNPKACRAVGLANGKNPLPLFLPCHRVIGANGTLTGFGGGLPAKRWLLSHEAAVIKHDGDH